jgi:3-deoxy-manno-octulosonate cytidylyltransferase (CMP-KDO synthetase)
MKTLIVIPARLASTRLPRKMLLRETGRPLIEHTYQSASGSKLADGVIVAADDAEIVDAVEQFGGQVMLTDPRHSSGTDRVAEVAAKMPEFDVYVNVQGDEPELSGASIDVAISLLKNQPAAMMATLATPIRQRAKLDDVNCVKVVINGLRQAMYFSRSPIPLARDWNDQLLTQNPVCFFQHIGLYAYRQEFLSQISSLKKPVIESLESLEQLRVLHAGVPIYVGEIESAAAGIDTPEDYAAFVQRWRRDNWQESP